MKPASVHPDLQLELDKIITHPINADREALLTSYAEILAERYLDTGFLHLNFICTHNSRRSQYAQIWAFTAAYWFGIRGIYTYSGGTEVTAVYENVVHTLRDQGIQMDAFPAKDQDFYAAKIGQGVHPLLLFSKRYDHVVNAGQDFIAVMTCGHADENCPYLPNAALRLSLNYSDPKAYDQSADWPQKYLEKSREIGSELFFLMREIRNRI